MAWTQPKTDWNANYVGDKYIGDHFDYRDYNRILDNVYELQYHSLMYEFGYIFRPPLIDTYKSFSDWARPEDDKVSLIWFLKIFASNVQYDTSMLRPLSANKPFWNADELNDIEETCVHVYDRYQNLRFNRPQLAFNFGTRGGL